VDSSPKTLTQYLRDIFGGTVKPVAAFLNRVGLTPNMVTLIGLFGQVIAAVFCALGYMTWGGIILVISAPLDFLDGTLARLRGTPTKFGAFFDSVTDRYAELAILGGIFFYYAQHLDWIACGVVYLAAAGSLMVPYVRARAEGVGYEAKIGILSRVERYLVLVPLLIFNQPFWAMVILAIFTNITALQRIFHVHGQAMKDPEGIIK
jgi:CDP-diacylglycerol--glycerol-3-phosphate 3-phosphatidyltransferase